jgi:5-methylcytosine-specific restriction endonuclease McrA
MTPRTAGHRGCTPEPDDMGARYGKPRRKSPPKVDPTKTVAEIVRELKKSVAPVLDYRERSLSIHGLICAKCGREFDHKDRHLLTVHHKDGNHNNNPSDGSNWENLCVYCHEDEHSRGLLADYFRKSQE